MEFGGFWFMPFLSGVIASEAKQSQRFWDCYPAGCKQRRSSSQRRHIFCMIFELLKRHRVNTLDGNPPGSSVCRDGNRPRQLIHRHRQVVSLHRNLPPLQIEDFFIWKSLMVLQEGIYWQSGQKPGRCYRLLYVNFQEGITASEAKSALAQVWLMITNLKQGIVQDLQPTRLDDPPASEMAVSPENLTCLLGFGSRLFNATVHTPPLVNADLRPPSLVSLPISGFRSLPWATTPNVNKAGSDLILQFIADTELAVNRAVVEIHKLILRGNPLRLEALFTGFQREDRRSWIDFHDGINTLRPPLRKKVMEVTEPGDAPWLVGGTFMAFLKIAVNLQVWEQLSRSQQELVVGRHKLTGCPLPDDLPQIVEGQVQPQFISGCPFSGTIPVNPSDRFIDPAKASNRLVVASHIHRANFNRGDDDQSSNNRIFRQGYEFLDAVPGGGISLGLNFVSFRKDVSAIRNILSIKDWMGSVNFGGVTDPNLSIGEPPAVELMSILAGGFFAIPPTEAPFPGASLFS
jgi:Dyp-type peroxidase family